MRDGEDSRASLGGMVDSANASDIMHMETPEAGRNALTAGLQQSHFTKGSGQQQQKPQQQPYQGDYSTGDLGQYYDQIEGKGAGPLSDVPVLGGLAMLGKSKNRGDFIQQAQRNHALGPFNPLHPVDWTKAAAADLQGTWQTGTRMYNAFNALFGDNNAIYMSMHDLYSDHNSFKRQLVNGMTGNALSGMEQLDRWDVTRPIMRDLIPGLLTSTVRYGMIAAAGEAATGSAVASLMGRFAPEATGLAARVLPTSAKWFASNVLPVMIMDGKRPDEILGAAVQAGLHVPAALMDLMKHPDEQTSQVLLASIMGAFLIGTGVKNPIHQGILSRFPVDKVMGRMGEKGKYAIDPVHSTFTTPREGNPDPLIINVPDPPKPSYQQHSEVDYGRVVGKLLLPKALSNLKFDAETFDHARVDVKYGQGSNERISAIPDAEVMAKQAEYQALKDAYLGAHKEFVKARNPTLYRDPPATETPKGGSSELAKAQLALKDAEAKREYALDPNHPETWNLQDVEKEIASLTAKVKELSGSAAPATPPPSGDPLTDIGIQKGGQSTDLTGDRQRIAKMSPEERATDLQQITKDLAAAQAKLAYLQDKKLPEIDLHPNNEHDPTAHGWELQVAQNEIESLTARMQAHQELSATPDATGAAPVSPVTPAPVDIAQAAEVRDKAKQAMEAHPLHGAKPGPKTVTSQEIFDKVSKEIERLRLTKDEMVTSTGEFMGKSWQKLTLQQRATIEENQAFFEKVLEDAGLKDMVRLQDMFSKFASLGSEKMNGRFMPIEVSRALLDHHEEIGKLMGHPLAVDDLKGPDTNLETPANGTLFDNFKNMGSVGNLLHSGAADVIGEIFRGVHANVLDPIGSILREGWGDTRAVDAAINEHFLPSVLLSLTEQFGRELKGFDPSKMTRMVHHSEEWATATPVERSLVQIYRRLTQVVRNERRTVGPDRGEEMDYLQRVSSIHAPNTRRGKSLQKLIRGDEPGSLTIGAGARATTEGRRAKVTIIKDNTIIVKDRFSDDPTEFNTKMAEIRDSFQKSQIKDGTIAFNPEEKSLMLSRGLDPEAIAEHLKGASKKEMVDASHLLFPDRETNFLKLLTDLVTKEMKGIKQRQAIDALTKIYMKVPAGEDTIALRAAVKIDELSKGELEAYTKAGYKNVLTGHEDYMFHPGYIDPLLTVAGNVTKGNRDMGALGTLIDHGQRLKGAIVYLPMKHRYNVLGRQMTFALSEHQPSALFGLDRMEKLKNELTGMGGYDPNKVGDLRKEMALRNEAWHYGMVPPKAGRYNEGWMASYLNAHGQSTGNVDGAFTDMLDDRHLPKQLQEFIKDSQRGTAAHYAQKLLPNSWHDASQKWLWDGVDHFGHIVYRLKKQEFLNMGQNEVEAGLNAADEANKWMGHVRPETWNPGWHQTLNTLMFAPNWQRTEEQLLFPMFDKDWRGVSASPEFKRQLFAQEIRFFSASMMMQQLTGNAMNMLLSNHPQWENQPGQRTKIEISRPEILKVLQDLHKSGTPAASLVDTFLPQKLNRKTGLYETSFPDKSLGQAMYISNPLTAQLEEIERYTGSYAQGAHLSPEDRFRDATATLLGVGAPMPTAIIGTAINTDLFSTLKTHAIQSLDPTNQNLLIQLLMGLSTLIPLAGAGQATRQLQAQQEAWMTSSTIPHPGTMDMIKNIKDDWLRGLMQAVHGVSPAYNATERTQGTQLGSDDRMKISQAESDYAKKAIIEANIAYTNGNFQLWLSGYKLRSAERFSNLQLMYKGTPQPIGDSVHDLLAKYDKIYTDNERTTEQGGGIDWAKYDQQNQAFWQKLTAGQAQTLHQVIYSTEAKDPMLRLYRQSIRDYAQFQEQMAGGNVSELRQQITEYNNLFGDSKRSRQYLATHKFLANYEKKKKVWEVTTPAGIAYGLFYGTSTVKTFMENHQANKQDILRYVEDQELTAEQSLLTNAGVDPTTIAQPVATP